MTTNKLNKIQLRIGTKVEMEHTKSKKVAKKIATKHNRIITLSVGSLVGEKRYLRAKKKDEKRDIMKNPLRIKVECNILVKICKFSCFSSIFRPD